MSLRPFVAAGALLLLWSGQTVAESPEPRLALRAARLVDGRSDRVRTDAVVIVEGERIVAVVATAKDRVKLAASWGARPPLRVLEMQVRWTGAAALPDLVRERLDAVRRGSCRA